MLYEFYQGHSATVAARNINVVYDHATVDVKDGSHNTGLVTPVSFIRDSKSATRQNRSCSQNVVVQAYQ